MQKLVTGPGQTEPSRLKRQWVAILVSRILIVALAAACLWMPLFHQVTSGWFTYADYVWLACAALLLFFMWLPLVLQVNLLILILGVLLIEGVFRLGGKPMSSMTTISLLPAGELAGTDDVRIRPRQLGYAPRPGIAYQVRSRIVDREIFNVAVHIDEKGRRATPVHGEGRRSKHVMAFGGSLTYGYGVNDDETWLSQLARYLPDHQPYNYAYGGYGPQHMLAHLESGKLRAQVAEGHGVAIYYFINDHVPRVIGTMKTMWVHRSPVYRLDETGNVQRRGLFHEIYPYRYLFYREFLLKSAAVNAIPFDYPFSITDEHLQLACAVIAESAQRYREQFAGGSFYMVIGPSASGHEYMSVGTRNLGREMDDCIRSAGIIVLDYSNEPLDETDIIWGDGHPTAAYYERIARRLAGDLQDYSPSL